jgi:hypothetical protein
MPPLPPSTSRHLLPPLHLGLENENRIREKVPPASTQGKKAVRPASAVADAPVASPSSPWGRPSSHKLQIQQITFYYMCERNFVLS